MSVPSIGDQVYLTKHPFIYNDSGCQDAIIRNEHKILSNTQFRFYELRTNKTWRPLCVYGMDEPGLAAIINSTVRKLPTREETTPCTFHCTACTAAALWNSV